MNKNLPISILLLTVSCVACSDGGKADRTMQSASAASQATNANNANTNSASAPPTTQSLPSTEPLSDPKTVIAYQFELLKAGETEKLKVCFTEWLRERITTEQVEKGKSMAARYTLDDLVASIETGESDGKKTAKIKMKNGRTLTMLIETDGRWLADTIWFK